MEPRDFADAFNTATPEQLRAAALLAEARQERDEARAIASEEREHIRRLRRELGETRGKLDTLREAARALVADLESDEGHWPGWCDHPRCRRLFTLTDGKGCTCDEHQGDLIAERLQDCSYTPALRRLMGTKKEGA